MKTLNNENEKYIKHHLNGVFHMTDINVNFQLDKSIHTRAKELALKKGVTLKKLYTDWIIECLERETSQTSLYDKK